MLLNNCFEIDSRLFKGHKLFILRHILSFTELYASGQSYTNNERAKEKKNQIRNCLPLLEPYRDIKISVLGGCMKGTGHL